MRKTILLSTALSFLPMVSAFALPLTASTILQDFNAVIYTNGSIPAVLNAIESRLRQRR